MKLNDPQRHVLTFIAQEQLRTGNAVPGRVIRRRLSDNGGADAVNAVLDSIPRELVAVGGYERPQEDYWVTLDGFLQTRFCGDVSGIVESTIRFFDHKLEEDPYASRFDWPELSAFLQTTEDSFTVVHVAIRVAGLHGTGGAGDTSFGYALPSDIEEVLQHREIGQLRRLRASQRAAIGSNATMNVGKKLAPSNESEFDYDVALSFAGEERHHADGLAALLKTAGVAVFCDKYETADLWGRDLFSHLHDIYSKRARYVVLFASAAYRRKVWTNHERRAAQERVLHERGAEYILPVRVDDTEIPGLPSTVAYLNVSEGIEHIFLMLMKKLGRSTDQLDAVSDRDVGADSTFGDSRGDSSSEHPTLADLTADATYVLRRGCEIVLETNATSGFVDGGEDLLIHAEPPLSRDACRQAIDLLVECGYLRGAPVFGAGRKWVAFTVTADGFHQYGAAFVQGFEQRVGRIVGHVVEVTQGGDGISTAKVASELEESHVFVCLVLQDLVESDSLKGQRLGRGEWIVHSPAAKLKVRWSP